ncbi:hypothetical protein [Streptomyces sp. NPDC050856]|uniref:hypothetical protein n=1 Tax=Streptomyces sp. NPDC050856 TaxID=3154939 RepID=UPI0033F42C58
MPVVFTTLEQLQEHGADAAVWRHLGRKDEQTLADALGNPDGDALYRRQYARAEEEDERRRAAEREARRPVCSRCGQKCTDQRWEETTARTAWSAGDLCGDRHADDLAREAAAVEAARIQAATPRSRSTTRSWASPAAASSADGPDRGRASRRGPWASLPGPATTKEERVRSFETGQTVVRHDVHGTGRVWSEHALRVVADTS